MSPEPAGPIRERKVVGGPAHNCRMAKCPLMTGCDRAASKGGLAVGCPVLGHTRIALAKPVPVRRAKAP